MNTILYIASGIVLFHAFVKIFYAPFFIGEDLGKYKSSTYVIGLVSSAAYILVAGHIFGWW